MFNVQKHDTEYHIEGKLNYTVTQEAFSNAPSSRHFGKKINGMETRYDVSAKEEMVTKFLSVVKQKINRIHNKYEDEDEHTG